MKGEGHHILLSFDLVLRLYTCHGYSCQVWCLFLIFELVVMSLKKELSQVFDMSFIAGDLVTLLRKCFIKLQGKIQEFNKTNIFFNIVFFFCFRHTFRICLEIDIFNF